MEKMYPSRIYETTTKAQVEVELTPLQLASHYYLFRVEKTDPLRNKVLLNCSKSQ
jgi:hypothetical protein